MSEARVNRILKPGDTDYESEMNRLAAGVDLSDIARMKVDDDTKLTGDGGAIQFEHVALPTERSPDLVIEHGVDKSGSTTHKLIFHFKNMAYNDMVILGKKLAEFTAEVISPLPGNVYASAGRNEIYKSNWDFITWGIPAVRSATIRSLVIQAAKAAFRD